MADRSEVIVEFLGVPRLWAGRAELVVTAGTVAEALAEVERRCPRLRGLVAADGRLGRHFLLTLDGDRFLTELARPLRPGERLVLLGADAGG